MAGDPDDTVRLNGRLPDRVTGAAHPVARRRPGARLIAAGLAVALACGAAGWLLLAPDSRVRQAPPTVASPVQPATPLLTQAEILALEPSAPQLLRLRENPQVFVLLFPDLDAQGAAMNRLAALVEKRGLPRDRVLGAAELTAAIAAGGDTPGTWFYGHDYRGRDLARFFALAERDGVPLNPAELWVARQWRQARAEAEGEIALVSIAVAGPGLDAAMRASILRHEIGHGHYFTWAGLAAHVHQVWRSGFTAAERAAFRSFLEREGYEDSDEELMANETMAYLLFTPDPRLFSASMVGLGEAVVERLRGLMRAGPALP